MLWTFQVIFKYQTTSRLFVGQSRAQGCERRPERGLRERLSVSAPFEFPLVSEYFSSFLASVMREKNLVRSLMERNFFANHRLRRYRTKLIEQEVLTLKM